MARLGRVDVEASVGFVFETVRLARKALGDRVPLIGFAGAPFTLASYLIEGGASREFLLTKRFMRAERDAWHAMLGRLAGITADYLNGQIAAGAQAVQLFDSWVGALSPADYREFVLPHSRCRHPAPDSGHTRHPLRGGHGHAPSFNEGSGGRRHRPRLARRAGADMGAARLRRGRAGQPRPGGAAVGPRRDPPRRQGHPRRRRAAARATSSTSATASTRKRPSRT